MRTKDTDRYQVTCEIPHDSGMHEWVVEVGGEQIYITSAHEDAVAKFINDANFYTDTPTTPMDDIHSRLEKMAKELLDECKEVLNDDGEFLFGKPSKQEDEK